MANFAGVDPGLVFLALLGGVFPAILWLLFWLREDKRHPEPRTLLIGTFLAGVATVLIALPIEERIVAFFGAGALLTIVCWAATEEILKFGASLTTGLASKAFDEPIDAMVYLITAALGFSAFENTLFILKDLLQNGGELGLLTGSMRAIGATLLHVAASALVGGALAYTFYRSRWARAGATAVGIVLAIALHSAFNQLILVSNGEHTLAVFGGLWVIIVGIILFFEYIKNRAPKSSLPSSF